MDRMTRLFLTLPFLLTALISSTSATTPCYTATTTVPATCIIMCPLEPTCDLAILTTITVPAPNTACPITPTFTSTAPCTCYLGCPSTYTVSVTAAAATVTTSTRNATCTEKATTTSTPAQTVTNPSVSYISGVPPPPVSARDIGPVDEILNVVIISEVFTFTPPRAPGPVNISTTLFSTLTLAPGPVSISTTLSALDEKRAIWPKGNPPFHPGSPIDGPPFPIHPGGPIASSPGIHPGGSSVSGDPEAFTATHLLGPGPVVISTTGSGMSTSCHHWGPGPIPAGFNTSSSTPSTVTHSFGPGPEIYSTGSSPGIHPSGPIISTTPSLHNNPRAISYNPGGPIINATSSPPTITPFNPITTASPITSIIPGGPIINATLSTFSTAISTSSEPSPLSFNPGGPIIFPTPPPSSYPGGPVNSEPITPITEVTLSLGFPIPIPVTTITLTPLSFNPGGPIIVPPFSTASPLSYNPGGPIVVPRPPFSTFRTVVIPKDRDRA
ncbi:hypothetical protein BDV97DRAFT_414528 [Delphinella strobiligena]|nr:hypothetical protein BDV97DRAFT_414528 [Delphinella strobiligena]